MLTDIMNVPTTLDIGSLATGRPGLTQNEGGRLAECAMVCFERGGHNTVPPITLTGDVAAAYLPVGPTVTNQMRRSFADCQEAVEYGASGVAAVLIEKVDNHTVYERSPKDGGGFDYYLVAGAAVPNPMDDNFLAPAIAVLEVSGILKGTMSDVDARVRMKLNRLRNRPRELPATVIVVEFGSPTAQLARA